MPSDISNYLNQIRTAVYGREVREAIADGIEQCYNDTSNGVTLAETKLSELNGAVERLNGAVDNAEANMNEAVSDALESLGDAVESANGAVTTANAAATRAQELNTALGNNADDLVLVQETQPNEEFNKVWVKPTVEEHEVPTYEEFSDLKSALSDATGAYPETGWVTGKRIATNTDPVSFTLETRSDHDCIVVDCVAGEVFTVTGQNTNANYRLYCFTQSDGTIVEVPNSNRDWKNRKITAPTNATKLIINSLNSVEHKLYRGSLLVDEVGNLTAAEGTAWN